MVIVWHRSRIFEGAESLPQALWCKAIRRWGHSVAPAPRAAKPPHQLMRRNRVVASPVQMLPGTARCGLVSGPIKSGNYDCRNRVNALFAQQQFRACPCFLRAKAIRILAIPLSPKSADLIHAEGYASGGTEDYGSYRVNRLRFSQTQRPCAISLHPP
jgi:hypothetical protein